MRLFMLAMIGLLVAGCEDRGKCLESHTQLVTSFIYIPGAGGSIQMLPVINSVEFCDRYEFPNGRPAL